MKPAPPSVVRSDDDTATKPECDGKAPSSHPVKQPNLDSIALRKGARKKPGQIHGVQAWWSSSANPNDW